MDFKHKQKGDVAIHGAHGHAIEGSDMALAMDISGLLNANYPGYEWMVHVNSEGRVVDIKNNHISTEYGYRVVTCRKMPNGAWYNLSNDEIRKEALRGGGELLERAQLKRGKREEGKEADFVEGITKIQYQPAVQRNIAKYRELLNGESPTQKH